jgi:hypothetical protein
MNRALALILAFSLALPVSSWAQDAQPQDAIDASKLGVSLDRIKRRLVSESRETISTDGRRLNVRVDVFGAAPPIDLIPDDFSIVFGPVPGSAPTHQQHIDFVTPKEYSSPTFPVFGLAVWAAQKIAAKSKKEKCEEEIRNYRALVMQGVAVSAPRCTQ